MVRDRGGAQRIVESAATGRLADAGACSALRRRSHAGYRIDLLCMTTAVRSLDSLGGGDQLRPDDIARPAIWRTVRNRE